MNAQSVGARYQRRRRLSAILTAMGVSGWLPKMDIHNQEVVDALLKRVRIDGSGVVIVSRWSLGESGGYRERWSHLRIDGGARTRLKWGSTFRQLAPGSHCLQFGLRSFRNTWVEVEVSVPVDGHVWVEYQPAVWPWQRAAATVVE